MRKIAISRDEHIAANALAAIIGAMAGSGAGALGILRKGPFLHRTARGALSGGTAGALGYLGGLLGDYLNKRMYAKGSPVRKTLKNYFWESEGANVPSLLGIASGAFGGLYLGDMLGDMIGLKARIPGRVVDDEEDLSNEG